MRAEERVAVGDAANFVGDSNLKALADDLQSLAAPIERAEKVGTAIDRAAKLSGLPYWRVFNIWYGKARTVEPHERDAVTTALEKKRRDERRNEWQELWTRLLRLESALAQSDPDFHRPSIDALRSQRGRP